MAYFENKELNGESYDLSHLDPLKLDVAFEGTVYSVLVEFSCHCFTETYDPQKHAADVVYTHNGETRAFDLNRYQQSLTLPQRFQELGAQTVYHTKKESFFFLRNVELNEKKMPYVVFFRSFKADQKDIDVIVKVSSAYTKPSMTRYASPVKFHRMIAARAKNRKLPLGPAKQIKRG